MILHTVQGKAAGMGKLRLPLSVLQVGLMLDMLPYPVQSPTSHIVS